MTLKFKIFLIAFILSLPFWWGINISQENLEEFLFQREITRNPEILTARAGHLILEKKFQESKPIRKRSVEDLHLSKSEAAISVLIRPDQAPRILFEKNTDKKLPIASLVKLMTAHVVLEHYDLSQEIKISREAVLQEEEFGGLKVGQIISVEHLLYPLLIESSNDAAFALSEIIGQKEFVDLMNSEAERLALKSTYFANPTGLDPNEATEPISYSTVRDLAKFAEYLLGRNKINDTANKLIWRILSNEKINLYGQELVNTNELLNKIPGIIGGKTGETPLAGNCLLLVIQAPKNKGFMVNIILNSENRFAEMKNLINWTRDAYEW